MGIKETIIGLGTSSLFWILITVGMIIFAFLILFVMKKRKFKYPCLIQFDLGGGKIGMEQKKAGWFKSKKALFGLLDTKGERRLETNDGRIIYQGSTQDFHELNHKRGIICYAKPDDPKVLFPVKRIKIENGDLVEAVAPADYRDTSAKILQEATKETMSNWEKIAQYLVLGILAIVVLVCIILVIQYAKGAGIEANQILNEAIKMKGEILQGINVVGSNAP